MRLRALCRPKGLLFEMQRVEAIHRMEEIRTTNDSVRGNLPRVELEGPRPGKGVFCATCCLLYLGEVSSDQDMQEMARIAGNGAIRDGKSVIKLSLPYPFNNRIIREAVTVAGSVYYPVVREVQEGQFVPTGMPPMPVCWVHLQGLRPLPGIKKN